MRRPQTLTLRDCLSDIPDLPEVPLTGIAIDSRRVGPGDLFVAYVGTAVDGHDFVPAAVAAGASAVLVERSLRDSRGDGDNGDIGTVRVPVIEAADARRRVGPIAARFAGDPSADLGCVGITGTNGKTSVAYFVAQLLNALGEPAGFGGTLGWGFAGRLCGEGLTTADPITLQAHLASLVDAGARWVAMEVSSHALSQDRVAGVRFDIAAFTNLSRDHLDYHGDMDAYAAAKTRLFDTPGLKAGVINVDDPVGRRIRDANASGLQVLGVGTSPDADLSFADVVYGQEGTRARLRTPWGERELRLPVYGEFSVHNVLMAVGVCVLAGQPLDDVLAATADLESPPGRMQFLRKAGSPTVVIDYAHTPDALKNALTAVRAHVPGRTICVFGCGGNRDRGKRPEMAAAVAAGADVAIVTNDNPRGEDPAAIAADVCEGFDPNFPVTVELDRTRAIALAVERAGSDGLVLVAGKGHEAYQEIRDRRLDYSDLETVQQLLGN